MDISVSVASLGFPNIAGLAWGPENGTKVLCLHGHTDNAATMAEIGPLLANNGFRVVSLDMPGHGHSSHCRSGFYDGPLYVTVISRAVNNLGSEWERSKFFILAHSMGQSVASLFSGTFPEKVFGFVAIDGFGPFSNRDEEDVPDDIRRALTEEKVLRSKVNSRFSM